MQSSKIKISVQKSKFLILPFTFALCLLNFNLAFAAPWSLDLVSAVDGTDQTITVTPGATVNLRGIIYGTPGGQTFFTFSCGSTVVKKGEVMGKLINDLTCTLPVAGVLNPKLSVTRESDEQTLTEAITINFTYGNPGSDAAKGNEADNTERGRLAWYVVGILLTTLAGIIYYTRQSRGSQY